ncbi:TetR family transcriptional regulator [Georgenia yuyongxinii]|uniref:TetR family transcriptional regulator n=1 Tax=Georgenia yuyongxinii TaxID=2589797 RepID=A0A5B8C7U2_9MICO|nr:TetR family transcriptional regulator [Georgenia yuyongxinii]
MGLWSWTTSAIPTVPDTVGIVIPTTGDGAPGDEAADGRATRWAGHRSSRRAELVHAARRAVHHRGPDVSMEEIATEIGTSKSILYRYFTDKAGLQTAVGQAVLDRMREALAEAAAHVGGPRERISAMVTVYLEMVASSPHVYAFVTRPEAPTQAGDLRGFVAEVNDLVADSLLPALRGTEPPGTDVDDETLAVASLWASGVVGLVRSAAERWITEQIVGPAGRAGTDAALARMTRQELTAHLSDWLWDGAVGVTRRARRRSP